MIKVRILITHIGPGASYVQGEEALFSEAKAAHAAKSGWVEIIGKAPEATPKKVAPAAAPKVAPPSYPKMAPPLDDVDVILARFGDDVDAMREYAKSKGIKVGRSRKASTIAKKIAKHYQ